MLSKLEHKWTHEIDFWGLVLPTQQGGPERVLFKDGRLDTAVAHGWKGQIFENLQLGIRKLAMSVTCCDLLLEA